MRNPLQPIASNSSFSPACLDRIRTQPLARLLFHSLRDKLLRLLDQVQVYPTHGAGSFCNAPSSPERTTTIGRERQWNPLARAQTEEAFLARALSNLPSYPTYFNYLRAVNQLRTNVLRGIPAPEPLAPQRVRDQMARGIAVVDVRTPRDFAAGHIRHAYGIPLATPLSTWAGWVVPFAAPIILVADDSQMREEAVRQLIRIGYDDLRGYLEGGMAAWAAERLPTARVETLSAEQVYRRLAHGDGLRVLDVRQDAEWRAGHLAGALHVEGGRLRRDAPPLPKDAPIVVHCGHADRSTVAISLLQQHGYDDVSLLYGGLGAWQGAGYPVERDHE